MKTNKLCFLFATLVMCVVACSKKEILPAEEKEQLKKDVTLVPMTFIATQEDEVKTSISGTSILWKAGDKLAVFDNVDPTTPREFTAESDGAVTSFSGEVALGSTKFRAIYPYSAAASCNWTVDGEYIGAATVNIPSVQTPTINSFDPAAAVLSAYATSSDSKLRFRVPFGLMKFTVAEDNVYSVSFSSGKNMTGSLLLKVKENGSVGSGDGSGDKYKTLVIKNADNSPLEQGNYYAVMRYRDGANSYTDFSITYGKTDGTYATRTADDVVPLSIANIRNIVFSDALSYVPNRYQAYQDGFDVFIAGQMYNKASHGDARLLSNAYVVKTGDTGVLFVEASASVTNTSEYTITGDVVLASNDPTHPATYTGTSGKSLLVKSGSLVMDNLKVNMAAMTSGQFFAKKDNDGNFSSLTLWQCDFSNVARPVYAPNSSYLNNGIENVQINGCRFGTTADVQLFSIGSGATTLAGYKTFTFTNNVLYSTGEDAQTGTYVFYTTASGIAESTCVQDLIMDNNLFYNVPNGNGLFRTHYLKSAYIRNNILWAQDGTYGSNSKMFKTNLTVANATGGAFAGASSNNYCYGNLGTKSWSISDSDCRGPLTNVTTLDSTPIKSFVTSTGVFELVSPYDTFGPQLQPN